MTSKWIVKLIVAVALFASSGGIASAAYIYTVSPTSISASNGWLETASGYRQTVMGADAWSSMTTNAFGDGLWASLKVNEAYCPSYCMVRLHKDVGFYNGNLLRVEFRLGKWDENQNIRYRIREMDAWGNAVHEVADGYLGASIGQQWTIGEPIIMAAAVEGNEIIFYANKEGLISKVQLLGLFTPLTTPNPWRVLIWTETANDSMTAEASGFMAVDVSE